MPICRACQAPLSNVWVDLGHTPLVNAPLLSLNAPDVLHPLKVMVCDQCWLVQTVEQLSSSPHYLGDSMHAASIPCVSSSYAETFVERTIHRLNLNSLNLILDIAVNDGDLLHHFKRKHIQVLGIESVEYTAEQARSKGIPVEHAVWNKATAENLARRGVSPDLIVANNVLPFVADLHEVVAGCARVLSENGWAVFEFPHVASLMDYGQFDAIDHEHLSYLSLTSLMPLFLHHGLVVADVETLPMQGGSLRVWLRHAHASRLDDMSAMRVAGVLAQEWSTPLDNLSGYQGFQQRLEQLIQAIRAFLVTAKAEGKRVVGYGATAKGNTLLNVAHIGPDHLSYVVDRVPSKQGCWLPGCRIPVADPAQLHKDKPDYLLILPWHLKDEVWEEWGDTFRKWGGQAVVAIPKFEILS